MIFPLSPPPPVPLPPTCQAATRAKERLILTRPRWRYLPRALADASPDELRALLAEGAIAGQLAAGEIRPSSFLEYLDSLQQDRPVLVTENHSRLPEFTCFDI